MPPQTPIGSRRIDDVWPAMYSALARALEDARGGGHEADLVGGRRDLLADRQRERLAGVLGLERRELLAALLELVGDPQQREAALGRRGVAPLLEAGARGGDGGVDVGRRSRCPSRR